MTCRARSRRPSIVGSLCIMAALVVAMMVEQARSEPISNGVPGATLDDVLAIARRLSPDLAARALDTEAALARVEIAGSLPDPMVRVTSDEIDRTRGPRQNKMIYG